jgi:hypothetical protein
MDTAGHDLGCSHIAFGARPGHRGVTHRSKVTSGTVVGPHGSITTRTAAGANAEDAAGENHAGESAGTTSRRPLKRPDEPGRPPADNLTQGKVKYGGMEH